MSIDELIRRVEGAPAKRPDRTLNREVALAVGWARLTPTESRKSYPTWYHPDDVRNGRPVFDSLHGTDVWREPLDYLGSLDAAMTLVPEGWGVTIDIRAADRTRCEAHFWFDGDGVKPIRAKAATPALALTAAALRALASKPAEENPA